MKGTHIVLEGIDGAGTTTQRACLAAALKNRGFEIHETAEPSALPVGKLIRRALQKDISWEPSQFALAFALDRLDHVQEEILPAMQAGKIVLSDRYVISSLVYQSLELPLDWVKSLNQHAPEPDLTLLVDLEVTEAEARRTKRGGPEEIFDATETQQKLRAAYLNCTKDYPNAYVVSGHGTMEEVTSRLLNIIDSHFA
jgi:dTMP kinase